MVPSTCNKPGGSNAPAHDIRGHKLIPSAASKTFYYDRDVTKEDWVDEGELCQNLGAELNIFLFKFPARNPVSGVLQSSLFTPEPPCFLQCLLLECEVVICKAAFNVTSELWKAKVCV